jgi:hypothetical protein
MKKREKDGYDNYIKELKTYSTIFKINISSDRN